MRIPSLFTERTIIIGIAILVVAASLIAGGYVWYTKSRVKLPPQETPLLGWQAIPASGERGEDRITNEQQKFAAVAPLGWKASIPNSGTAAISKEDFSECTMTLVLGSNDGYLSASGYVDQLNPPGPKPPTEEHRFAGTITVGGWPAAIVTILDKFHGEQKEVDIPRGNMLFIVRMSIKGLLQDKIFVQHPRLKECEDAFEEFLKSFKIQ